MRDWAYQKSSGYRWIVLWCVFRTCTFTLMVVPLIPAWTVREHWRVVRMLSTTTQRTLRRLSLDWRTRQWSRSTFLRDRKKTKHSTGVRFVEIRLWSQARLLCVYSTFPSQLQTYRFDTFGPIVSIACDRLGWRDHLFIHTCRETLFSHSLCHKEVRGHTSKCNIQIHLEEK